MTLFEPWVGYMILLVYGALTFALTSYFAKGFGVGKEGFLLARRNIGLIAGSFGVAAAWLWTPGLFISSQQAYLLGMAGLFWFCVGNVTTLALFAWFAHRVRRAAPEGWTFSGFVRERYGSGVQSLYLIEMIILAVCGMALNLIAGSQMVNTLTGMPYWLVTILMVFIALLYSFNNGLKATVVTEIVKITVVWTGVFVLVPWVIAHAGGWDVVARGMAGRTGLHGAIWGTEAAWVVFATFGLAAVLGHLGGPWGDNSFWQRSFAIKSDRVLPAFVLASFIFGVIPIAMGLLGFVAAGAGLQIAIPQMTNVLTISHYLPTWTLVFFVFMILAGLVSVLDSQLSSISSMAGHDLHGMIYGGRGDNIRTARIGMVLLVLLGLAIANFPGVTLVHLFLFYAVTRATVWLPSMIVIVRPKWVNRSGMFWGLLAAYLPGQSMFLYGQYTNVGVLSLWGTITAILLSPVLVVSISALSKQTEKGAARASP